MNPYEMFEATADTCVLQYGDFKIEVKRAGSSNSAYTKLLAAKVKPFRFQIQSGTIDADVIRKVMAEVFAKTVIVGWEGVTDRKGKKLEFTHENCVKVLTDLPDMFEDIQDQADKLSNFRKEENEEVAKNSPKS